jgi:hypothetical protein
MRHAWLSTASGRDASEHEQSADVSAVATVKRDQGRRPNSLAGGAAFGGALIHSANEPDRPIALDLAATLPHLHRRPPGDPSGQHAGGVHPPAPPLPAQAAASAVGQATCSW